jgi:hypothetical protein
MLPTEDHVNALREIIAAGRAGDEGRLAAAFGNAELLLNGGKEDEDEGERTLSAMERGIGGGDDIETMVGSTDDGYVILRFSRLVQWVRYDPFTMMSITEAQISAARSCSKIWTPPKKKLVLPGLPGGS